MVSYLVDLQSRQHLDDVGIWTGGIEVVVGRPPEQQVYKYSNLSTFIMKNQHIFGEPCINPASEFHKLQQRFASPDSFSNLYEFLGLRPLTPSHRGPAPASLFALDLVCQWLIPSHGDSIAKRLG